MKFRSKLLALLAAGRGTIPLGFAVAVGLLVIGVKPGLAEPDRDPDAASCGECHSCPQPTRTDPCLVSRLCERHAGTDALSFDLGPREVILDQLEHLYGPVRFNHLAHARMAEMDGGCESCHHFTPPTKLHPQCQHCHPASVSFEDLSQPGLKGAYHRNCLRCHMEWDNDTACEACHLEKKPGGPTGVCPESPYPKLKEPGLIIYETDYDDGDQVPFQHRSHSDEYGGGCADCHRAQNCATCHGPLSATSSSPIPVSTNWSRVVSAGTEELHDVCFQCHDDDDCESCHGGGH